MKNKRFKKFLKELYMYSIIVLSWLMIMLIGYKVAILEKKVEWLEAQQDNVIETLIIGND